jgi:precorrin-3B C17-methyltransferase
MGKIFVVGIGPGDIEHITCKAKKALEQSECILGYKTYIDLIRDHYPSKKMISFPMRSEVERCELTIEKSKEHKHVSLISGGDPGVYGMAGILLEIAEDETIEVVPGMTAIQAAAASLGAPIMHDYVSISLSDLLTDWSVIEKRLTLAAKGDFVTCLYNPKSKTRTTQIEKAQDIFINSGGKDKIVGIIKNAKRKNEKVYLTTVEKMLEHPIDMSTIVIIGNHSTFIKNNYMITKRGYSV